MSNSPEPGEQVESQAHRKPGFRAGLLSLPVAVLLLFLALRGVEWQRVLAVITRARAELLAFGCLLATISYFLRSLRWRVLLNAEMRLGVATVFWATMAGYLGNNVLPARAGELVRSLMISAHAKLSKTFVLTTALTERLVDVIVLAGLSAVVLGTTQQGPDWMVRSSRGVALLAGGGLVVFTFAPWWDGPIMKLLAALPIPERIRRPLLEMTAHVLLGLRCLHHFRRFASFSALTLAVWLLDAAGAIIVARALGLQMSFPVALLLLTGLGLGSALPSTPGYIGIYQFVAVTVLTPFGFRRSDAIAYILVAQLFGYLVITLWGIIGLWQFRRAEGFTEARAPLFRW